MQSSVEKLSNIEYRISVTVPANNVEEMYTKQINEIAKTANIKGFRPGKAPVSYVVQRFGDEAKHEALSRVIQEASYKAISEHDLRPINQPRIEPKSINFGQPLEFDVFFEVMPEIGQINFDVKNVDKYEVELTEQDITDVTEKLRSQHTQWKEIDRAAAEGDRVVIDYYAIYEGKSDIENKVHGFTLELGSKVMLPGFEQGLIGAKAGEERTLNLTFPADFNMQDRAGKPIDFVVNVKQVFEAIKPEIDAKFMSNMGIKSGDIEDLKKQIRQSLEQERDRLVREKLKEQVFNALLEQNPLEIPSSLIEREAKNIHDEVYQHQHDHNHSETEMDSFKEIAKKRVKLGLLLDGYAKQSNLTVDNDKVKKRIEEIASVYESPEQVIAWLSNDQDRRSRIEALVIEEQVVDKLTESVPATTKAISYADLRNTHLNAAR